MTKEQVIERLNSFSNFHGKGKEYFESAGESFQSYLMDDRFQEKWTSMKHLIINEDGVENKEYKNNMYIDNEDKLVRALEIRHGIHAKHLVAGTPDRVKQTLIYKMKV